MEIVFAKNNLGFDCIIPEKCSFLKNDAVTGGSQTENHRDFFL